MRLHKISVAFLMIFVLLVQNSFAQEKAYKHEIQIQNDNDVYLLTAQDRYYTNGINMNYRLALNFDTTSYLNRVLDIELGQKMYNGVAINQRSNKNWDRPFAAYLYSSAELNQFYKHDAVLSYRIQIGVLGPIAQGEEFQELIHQVFSMYEVNGWESQVKNSFTVDIGLQYQTLLFKNNKKDFDISAVTAGWIGSNQSQLSLSLPIRFGRFNRFDQSVFTKGHVNQKSSPQELFIHYTPTVLFQAYNASVQGGYFNHDSAKDNYQIQQFMVRNKIGLMYAHRRSSVGLSYIFQSNEAKDMVYKHHQYGQIYYGLRF